MPPVVVFIGEQRFKDLQRLGQPARQSQVRTVAPVQGWTQATNELPGQPTTEDVAGSHDPCADEKEAPTLLDQLRRQKHPQLMAGRGTADDPRPPLMCFCNEPLALRVSRTTQNPDRLFLGCKSQKCRFFQWTDQPWSPTLCDRWAQVLRHLSP